MFRGKLTVLLVEDNPAHAEMVIRSFDWHNAAGHINHVSDGQTALNYLFRQGDYANAHISPRPDIILLDLRLPDIDGLDVLAALRQEPALKDTQIVAVTATGYAAEVMQRQGSHFVLTQSRGISTAMCAELLDAALKIVRPGYAEPSASANT